MNYGLICLIMNKKDIFRQQLVNKILKEIRPKINWVQFTVMPMPYWMLNN